MRERQTGFDSNCDGVLLSGGRGRRVGGRDKGFLQVGDDCAAAAALRLLRPLCDRLYVSANRNLDSYAALAGVTVVSDLRGDFSGPLAALEALASCPLAPLLLILPNDLPLLQPSVPQRLLSHMRAADRTLDGVFASDGKRPQYLCACLRRHCLDNVGARLSAGDARVYGWLQSWNVQSLQFSGTEATSLRNFNTWEQWATLPRGEPRDR